MNPDNQQLKRLKSHMKKYPDYVREYGKRKSGLPCPLTREEMQWMFLISHYLKIKKDTVQGRIFYLRYCKGKSNVAIQLELFIERTTYFKHHAELIQELYMLAVVLGLLPDRSLDRILQSMRNDTEACAGMDIADNATVMLKGRERTA